MANTLHANNQLSPTAKRDLIEDHTYSLIKLAVPLFAILFVMYVVLHQLVQEGRAATILSFVSLVNVVIAIAGYALLQPMYFALLLTFAVASWAALIFVMPTYPNWIHFGVGMAVSSAISVAVNVSRRLALFRVEVLRQQSEMLLLNILPGVIAERLKAGEEIIADEFGDVSVMFADIVKFTSLSSTMNAREVVLGLNEVYSTMDDLAEKHGLEKIKTIGDSYMVVGGIAEAGGSHLESMAEMALDLLTATGKLKIGDTPVSVRVGIHTGPAVAGVIGTKKFAYDLWGDTVNTASRMESQGDVSRIQVTESVKSRLESRYTFESRGTTSIKGKGQMTTYYLLGHKEG